MTVFLLPPPPGEHLTLAQAKRRAKAWVALARLNRAHIRLHSPCRGRELYDKCAACLVQRGALPPTLWWFAAVVYFRRTFAVEGRKVGLRS